MGGGEEPGGGGSGGDPGGGTIGDDKGGRTGGGIGTGTGDMGDNANVTMNVTMIEEEPESSQDKPAGG